MNRIARRILIAGTAVASLTLTTGCLGDESKADKPNNSATARHDNSSGDNADATPAPAGTPQSTDTAFVNGMPNPCSLAQLRQLRIAVDKRLLLSDKDKYFADNSTTRYCTYDGYGFGPQVTVTIFGDGSEQRVSDMQDACQPADADTVDVPTSPGCAYAEFDPELYMLNGVHGDSGISRAWFTFHKYDEASRPDGGDPTKHAARLSLYADGHIIDLMVAEGDKRQLIDLGRIFAAGYREQSGT